MKLSQYFGKEYKILDIDLCEQINVYEILNSVEKQEIEGFFIHQSSYLELLQVDLSFLDLISNKDKIKKICLQVDLSEKDVEKLYAFRNIDALTVTNAKGKEIKVDLSNFSHLLNLTINGQFKLMGLNCIGLKKLLLNECKKIDIVTCGSSIEDLSIIHSKDFCFEVFKSLNLKKLELIQVAIDSLKGIEKFKDLESIKIGYCSKLVDISALSNCQKLKKIEFESDKKVNDFGCLGNLKKVYVP